MGVWAGDRGSKTGPFCEGGGGGGGSDPAGRGCFVVVKFPPPRLHHGGLKPTGSTLALHV